MPIDGSARSTARMWAARGRTTSSACGMRVRMSSIIATGVAGSSAPAMISVGARIAALLGRRSISRIAMAADCIAARVELQEALAQRRDLLRVRGGEVGREPARQHGVDDRAHALRPHGLRRARPSRGGR